MNYAELFCQSNFSFLEGASHPQELLIQADFLAYQAIAITDECSVAGVVRAYTVIKDHKLKTKLIIGSMFKLGLELRLVLLCPNRQAYAELCRIITNARRRSPKGQYELNQWDLSTCKHCLVLWLPQGNKQADNEWGLWLKKTYQERLWIGLQRHLIANEHDYIKHCESLAEVYRLPISACGGVLFHTAQRLALQHVLSAIKAGSSVDKMGRQLLANHERCLRPLDKLAKLFKTQWLEQSCLIAELCTFSMGELKYEYPSELVPKGSTASEHLRTLVLQGMTQRFAEGMQYKLKRIIVKELKLVKELAYEHFFLTIHDIVSFAQKQQILYQGRGSAANSVVCYCLGITASDPRQIEVLFERFISKERQEPPDIDVDFEHERREEIIQYIYQKYGRERAAIASVVVTYRHKSAIREVGKALGINPTQLEFFIKNINHRDHQLSWENQLSELGLSASSSQGQRFVSLVNELKGFPRHLSQHVGGFVISSGPLYHLVPIENAAMPERSVIQWDKDDIESLELIKVDVLALGMLTAIRKSFDLIKQHYQHGWSIPQITQLPDDPQVYRMIQRADTVGVFQIESRAQMSMLPRLKPKEYYDLVIQIAIVRPGPIQGKMVHPYLRRRDGKEKIEYPSQAVKAVLSRTLGVPIFQEQVIKIAMVAAGFTGGEADQLRRAMASWKKSGELLQFREKLINGMLQRGYQQDYAERIYQQICGFGEYGFPESHSASFAVLTYTSCWLKYYYPAAFYVGLLNSWPMGFYAPSQLVQNARRQGIPVLPICINYSTYDHLLENVQGQWGIRLGLRLIKSLPIKSSEWLIKHRPNKGFASLEQLRQIGLPQSSLELLASANALQSLTKNRYSARWSLSNQESSLPLLEQQVTEDIFTLAAPNEINELHEDYSATSLSLGKHPIRLLMDAGLVRHFTPADQLAQIKHKMPVTVIGVVIGRQRPGTSNGVTFMTLEDHTGCSNVIVWLATAREQKKAFLKSKIVQIKGILERGDGDVTHIIAGKITNLSHLLNELDSHSRDFH